MRIKVLSKKIGLNYSPFIIAEISANHNQSISTALKIIKGAAKAGVDAIKLQTYTADTMTLNLNNKKGLIKDTNSPWYGKNLYKLYQRGSTPWVWHKKLFSFAKKLGLIAFSTPFDISSVDFLKKLNVPIYKISSFEITDIPLIKKVALTRKPVIVSTGMANMLEIKDAVKTLKQNGCKKIILLKCTSSYPCDAKDVNLATIPVLRNKFKCEVGLSDHTVGEAAAIASIGLGSTVIEKHVTLNKNKSIDGSFSLDLKELKNFVKNLRAAKKSIGKIKFEPTENEKKNLKYRRGVVAIRDIKKNEKFTKNNIKCLRGMLGLEPKYYYRILNKNSKKFIRFGQPIKFNLIK